jgi:hypothetical protein
MGECWLNCHPIGDNGPIVVALPASNEKKLKNIVIICKFKQVIKTVKNK